MINSANLSGKPGQAHDWAYTHLNYGMLFSRRAGHEGHSSAIIHNQEAKKGAVAAGDVEIAAQAEHNIAAELLALAGLEDAPETGQQALLEEAEGHARASLDYRAELNNSNSGRTWAVLGDILRTQPGRTDEAKQAYSNSLISLTPSSAHRECRNAAWSLANIEMDANTVTSAVGAWRIAVDAAEILLTSRSTREGRLEEIAENTTLHRFASYAFAKNGQLADAIETLERGRARELAVLTHADLLDLEQLKFFDRGLYQEFVRLRREIEQTEGPATQPKDTTPTVWEEFQGLLTRIRSLPGFENALASPALDEISVGLACDQAIAYIVSSPFGSATLLVAKDDENRRVERMLDVPDLTSTLLVEVLMGFSASGKGDMDTAYVLAQAGKRGDLDASLQVLESTVGLKLLRPLSTSLRRLGISKAVIIPTGLLGLVPLHSLLWRDQNGPQCLLDDFEITYCPSALFQIACSKRASESGVTVTDFLAIGNPLPHPNPLKGAESEAKMVVSLLGCSKTTLLLRQEATKDRIQDRLPRASHVHLACHGQSSFLDEPLSGGLSVANGEMIRADEILDRRLCARLVVLSACETGIIQHYWTIDEAFSLETAFLAAGVATVISTFWAVDDMATSMLICNVYEGIASGDTPANALRQSQIWLRDLSGEEAEQYISARAVLRSHRDRMGPAISYRSIGQPFKAYRYWAGFKVSGA